VRIAYLSSRKEFIIVVRLVIRRNSVNVHNDKYSEKNYSVDCQKQVKVNRRIFVSFLWERATTSSERSLKYSLYDLRNIRRVTQ